MRLRRLAIGCLVALLTLFVARIAFVAAKTLRRQSTIAASVAAFTVTMSSFVEAVGRPETRRQVYYLEAFRTDGSAVWATLDSDLRQVTRRISLVAERQEVIISEPGRLKSTRAVTENAVFQWKSRFKDSSCTAPVFGGVPLIPKGEAVVQGVQTVKTLEDTARARVELWRAPSLNCQPLYQRFEWKSAQGLITDTTTYQAIRVLIGDPDPALFDYGGSYVEATPSEVADSVRSSTGGYEPNPAVRDDQLRKFKHLDEVYRKANPPK